MSRLQEIHKGLEDVGYSGPLIEFSQLEAAVDIGQKDEEYTKLVNFLTNEIRILLKIDEEVNAISSPEDSVAFVMEITSFLKELGCPYKSLTQGLVSERFQNVSERLLLLDYLISELMGARILQEKNTEKKVNFKVQETPEASDIRQILQALRFSRPPSDITTAQLFDKLDKTIPLVLRKAKADLVGEGIFDHSLSDNQWETLREVQEDLQSEYKIRREMLLNRLDVTIQSFQWSDRTKGKEALFEKIYYDKRKLLKAEPDVDISSLIAARTDLAIIEKTSNASVRKNTQTAINKVTIGPVPDRGGRSWEQAPPPAEMPTWQPRSGRPSEGGASRGNGEMESPQSSKKESHLNDSNNKQGSSSGRQSGGHQDHDNNRSFSNRGGNNSRGHGGNSYRGGNDHYHYKRRDSGGSYGSPPNKRSKVYDYGGRGNYYRGRPPYYRGRVWF